MVKGQGHILVCGSTHCKYITYKAGCDGLLDEHPLQDLLIHENIRKEKRDISQHMTQTSHMKAHVCTTCHPPFSRSGLGVLP